MSRSEEFLRPALTTEKPASRLHQPVRLKAVTTTDKTYQNHRRSIARSDRIPPPSKQLKKKDRSGHGSACEGKNAKLCSSENSGLLRRVTFVEDEMAKTGRKPSEENKVLKNIRLSGVAAKKSAVKRPIVCQDTRNGHVVPVIETKPFMSRKSFGKIPTYLETLRQKREEEAKLKEVRQKNIVKNPLRPVHPEDENHALLLKGLKKNKWKNMSCPTSSVVAETEEKFKNRTSLEKKLIHLEKDMVKDLLKTRKFTNRLTHRAI